MLTITAFDDDAFMNAEYLSEPVSYILELIAFMYSSEPAAAILTAFDIDRQPFPDIIASNLIGNLLMS